MWIAAFSVLLATAPGAQAPVARSAEPARLPPLFPVRLVWSFDQGAAPAAPPVVAGPLLLTPLRTASLTATRLGRDVAWRHGLDAAGPLAADDRHAYVAMEGAIEALDLTSGEPRWRVPVGGRPSILIATSGWVIAALDGGRIEARRADDGAQVWGRDAGPVGAGNAVVAGEVLFVATTAGELAAWRIVDGQRLWHAALGETPNGVTVAHERVFVGAGKFFLAFDASSGRQEWRWRIGATVVGPPAVDDRHVYVMALDNQIRALDRRSGAQRWRQPLPARPIAGPVAFEGVVLTPCLAPQVLALGARDGGVVGRYPTDRDLASAPVLLPMPWARGGTVVVVTLVNGSVLALQRRVEPGLAPLATIPGAPVATGAAEPPAGTPSAAGG